MTEPAIQPGFADDPLPTYDAIRAAGGAVRDHEGVWVASSGGVDQVLRDPGTFSSVGAVFIGSAEPLIPLQVDPPDHRRYRKFLDPLFAPKRIARLEAQQTRLVNGLIDAFIDAGECEFVSQLAMPFPSAVFLDLLGLPRGQLPHFLALEENLIRPRGATVDEEHDTAERAGRELTARFEAEVAARRRSRRDDLISQLLDIEVDGGRLTHDEIVQICYMLFIAGLDTVASTLGVFFARLATDDTLRRAIVDDSSRIPSAIEELLRLECPAFEVLRVAHADTEVAGCPIAKGDIIHGLLGGANTDADDFPDPSVINIDRVNNRHLAFGGGIHRCLGSHLARLELRVATKEWHRRIPEYTADPASSIAFEAHAIRTVVHLPLRFAPRSMA